MEPSEFEKLPAQLNVLQGLGYKDRRRVLWHRNKPRLRRFLYKFRAFDTTDAVSVERVRDIVTKNRLRLSPPGELNDPFDMAVNVTVQGTPAEISQRLAPLLKKEIKGWEARQRANRRFLKNPQEILSKALTSFRATISACGVCSFGGDPRSILAWSHYALEHRGVCLQFETCRDLAVFAQALPVNYSEEYPSFNWVTESKMIPDKILLRKYAGWKYEDEHRIVRPEQARQFIDFRPIALSGIIIGCSANEKTVDELKGIITERRSLALPIPRIYRAFRHKKKFRLVIKTEDLGI